MSQSTGYFQYYTKTEIQNTTTQKRGLDVSRHQYRTGYDANGNSIYADLNWTQMKTKADFVIMKASGGQLSGSNLVADSQFTAAHVASARAVGLKVGTFHFARPSLTGLTTAAAVQEADFYVDTLFSVFGNGKVGDILPCLDWEDEKIRGWDGNAAWEWIEAFANRVKARTGVDTILYTAHWYVVDTLIFTSNRNNLIHPTKGNIKNVCPVLWWAAYSSEWGGSGQVGSSANSNMLQCGGFTKWDAWQYSADGNGQGSAYGVKSSDVDLDIIEDQAAFDRMLVPTATNFQYYTQANFGTKKKGCDIISSYYPVNFATLATKVSFINHRATYHNGTSLTTDTQFTTANMDSYRANNIKVGLYHVAKPSKTGTSTTGAITEADYFIAQVEAVMGKGDVGDILPVLQFQDTGVTWDGYVAWDWIEAFSNRIKEKTGKQCIIYTGYWYLDGNITTNKTPVLFHKTKGYIKNVCPYVFLSAVSPEIHGGSYPNYNYTIWGGYGAWDLWQYTTNYSTGNNLGSSYGLNTTHIYGNLVEDTSWNKILIKTQETGYFQYYTTGQMDTRDRGIDINSLNYPIDYNKLALQTQIKYVIHRASYMNSSSKALTVDSKFTIDNINALRSKGFKVGTYHTVRPSISGYGVDGAILEADFYADTLTAVFDTGNVGDILPVVDFEDDLATNWDGIQAWDWLEAFSTRLQYRTGYAPILKTGAWYINDSGWFKTNRTLLVHPTKGDIKNIYPYLWLTASSPEFIPTYGSYPNGNFKLFGGYTSWNNWRYNSDTTAANVSAYGLSGTTLKLDIFETGTMAAVQILITKQTARVYDDNTADIIVTQYDAAVKSFKSAITFDSKPLPDGVDTLKITHSLLPPLERNTVKINGRAGAYTLARNFAERKILLSFIIKAADTTSYMATVRQLAGWAYSPDPRKLIINNEPNMYYMAVADGETNIEQVSDTIGTVEVTFIASQPFAYDKTQQVSLPLSTDGVTPTTITNGSNFDAFPVYTLDFSTKATYCAIENTTTGDRLLLGAAVRVGEQNPYDVYAQDFNDPLSSLSTWTQIANGTANKIDDSPTGAVTAQFAVRTMTVAGSSQMGFGVSGQAYGSGSAWHGACAERVLTTAWDDFSGGMDIQMLNTNPKACGKIEMYLLGVDGSRIMKINFMDSANGVLSPHLWCKFYGVSSTNDWVGFTGFNSSVAQAKQRSDTYYYNPNGLIRIRFARRLSNWRVWIAVIDPADTGFGKVLRQDLFEFNDTNGLLNMQNLKTLRIATAAYGTNPVPTDMVIHGVTVNHELIKTMDTTGRPYIFQAGDRLTVNTGEATIFTNGAYSFDYLDPMSNFPKLQKGDNSIKVYSDGTISAASIVKNEKYI